MNKLGKLFLALLILVFVGAGGFLLYDFVSNEQDQNNIERLIQTVSESEAAAELQAETGVAEAPARVVQARVERITGLGAWDDDEPDRAVALSSGVADDSGAPATDAGDSVVPDGSGAPAESRGAQAEANGGNAAASNADGEKLNADGGDSKAEDSASQQPGGSAERMDADAAPGGSAERTDAGAAPGGSASADTGVEPGAENGAQGEAQSGQPNSEIDVDGLMQVVEGYIAQDQAFANPAIEVLRLQITPPREEGKAPSVRAKAMGEFLRSEVDMAALTRKISGWLVERDWQGDGIQLIDLRVHIELAILPQYQQLYNQNKDMVGWIEIPGTKTNCPVMQTPDDPEYYLHTNFEHKYAYSGLPFLDARNDGHVKTQNLMVYGHNMKSGTMFGQIPLYESKGFWKAHPTVRFDLLTEQREYEVFGMFRSREYKENEAGFRYYEYIDLSDLNTFNSYVQQVKSSSFIDTGITPQWGDQILTLSTCSYHTDKGSFVLVCRRTK